MSKTTKLWISPELELRYSPTGWPEEQDFWSSTGGITESFCKSGFEHELAKAKEDSIPFEDQQHAIDTLGKLIGASDKEIKVWLKPNTFIDHIELEVETVWQRRLKSWLPENKNIWHDCDVEYKETDHYDYRQVARLKPVRFIKTTHEAVGEEKPDWCTSQWWLDTTQPLNDPQKFKAFEIEDGKDPNEFVPVSDFKLLFTDQAEYYAVCSSCYMHQRGKQWSGSTHGPANWAAKADAYLKEHRDKKGWCEFCDPIFGNGGWL